MLFVFVDGLGLGQKDGTVNPIYRYDASAIQGLLESRDIITVDVCMGIKGLPQSATGQTALFTGVNASKVMGRHLSGQPTVTLRNIITSDNLFKRLISMGCTVTNSNVYKEEYIQAIKRMNDKRRMPSVTTVMCMSSGIEIRKTAHYREGRGVYHDVTGQILSESCNNISVISPGEAALRFYKVSRDFHFTLFEYFMTDIAGHTGDMEAAAERILTLDEFFKVLVQLLDYDNDCLVIVSDHGNIEDMSIKTHTYNKVPAIFLGKAAKCIRTKIVSLTDIMSAVIDIFLQCKNL
jgi:hypothetical protein